MLPLNRVLCPTDFSEPSYEALKVANELAEHFSAELLIVHVVTPIPVGPSPETFNVGIYQQELEKAAEKSLRDTVNQRVSKEVETRALVAYGDAADEIVRIAKEESVDLIVIATHGMSGWRHLIFGSVAEKVVRLTSYPVLTIRAPVKGDADAEPKNSHQP